MARARAARVQEEAISHVSAGALRSTEALLEYGCEEPVDLLVHDVPSDPRDVAGGEERSVADVLTFDEHEKGCETCRRAGYSLAPTRGLARMTRVNAARRPVTWLGLCPVGQQTFIESWTALGLALPEYAQEPT